jgi:transcriptional regulator with XRE-family HTH domain
MTYAERLKVMRQNAGLTQRELGLACGYDDKNADRTVRHWESGRSYPPLGKIRLLAKALGVSLDAIIP